MFTRIYVKWDAEVGTITRSDSRTGALNREHHQQVSLLSYAFENKSKEPTNTLSPTYGSNVSFSPSLGRLYT